jgi:hypothetical protein
VDLIRLIAPPGAGDYPISHDIVDYHTVPVYVDVPRDVALHLLRKGGFSVPNVDVDPTLSGETVRLVHKDGDITCTCGVDGVAYEPDADGVLTVASEHAPKVAELGFVSAPDKPQTKAEARAEAKADAAEAKADAAEAKAEAKTKAAAKA